MAKLSEEYVIEYLTRSGFTTARGIRKGVNEWDIFAINCKTKEIEACHLEVQVSYDPVSYLSSTSAKRRSEEKVVEEMQKWMIKKFTGEKVQSIRKNFYTGCWSYCLVHEVLADEREKDFLKQNGVKLMKFSDIVASLCEKHPRTLAFTAEGKDTVEVTRNLLKTEPVRIGNG